MFNKSDTLPLILAFVTTVVIVTLGFSWLAKSNKIDGFSLAAKDSDGLAQKNSSELQDARVAVQPAVKSNLAVSRSVERSIASNGSQFIVPVIVPQGTSVAINGSEKLGRVNQTLRRGFHQKYPGTVITTDRDGSIVSLDLLYERKIDLAALDRPLSQAEKAAGLTAIAIRQNQPQSDDFQMYYVYQEPLNPDTEIFLGYVLSEEGQQSLEELSMKF